MRALAILLCVLSIVGLTSTAALAQSEAPPDSTSDEAFLRRLQERDLEFFPDELLDFDSAFRDSVIALHDSLGLDEFAEAAKSARRRFSWGLGLGQRLSTFNRVEGFLTAGELHVAPLGPDGPRLSTEAGWAFASEEFRHSTELSVPIGEDSWRLDLAYRDEVVPFGVNRVFANPLRSVIGGADERDHLRRRGALARLSYDRDRWRATIDYEVERQNRVSVSTDFSLFGDLSRANPAIDEGIDRSLTLRLAIGESGVSRVQTSLSHRVAGGALGGDFAYQRSEWRLRARQYILRHEFVLQTRSVHTGGTPPEQQRADIGGLDQLRGFDPRWRVGDSSVASRLEARVPYDLFAATRIAGLRSVHLQVVPWVDAARVFDGDSRAWFASVGVGLQRFLGMFGRGSNLRLDLSFPLGPERSEDLRVALLFAPVF
jgi:hypothetical protein